MPHQLSFQIKYHFTEIDGGITIPAGLMADNYTLVCEAKIDSGAEYCLFQRELAERLNLDVESGIPVRLKTLAGSLTAYGHSITLETLGLAFESTVLFTAGYGTKRNILGRNGWLNNLHLALTMDDEMVYLSHAWSQENL